MLNPHLSMAVSVHANPGVYAVLVGSGFSNAAAIPTGWAIVTDLVRKLAKVSDENCEPEPANWYEKKYGYPPTYDKLLAEIATTSAERTQLLARYIEPDDADRENNLKQPTNCHRALAWLVKQGFIKVILTTNFDRLIEQALGAEGIEPTVIYSPDDARGAMPLVHSACTLVKLHGDYRDLRTKNTPSELEQYDLAMQRLLNRVLDEYGLIVCGWSAEWDKALRNTMCRRTGRRFTLYWMQHGQMTIEADQLCKHRGAQIIPITSADEAFSTLKEQVEALNRSASIHPMSTPVAVARIKKYLSEERYRIDLHDLVMGELERVVEETGPDKYPVIGNYTPDQIAARIQAFEAISEALIAIAVQLSFWGNDDQKILVVKIIERLADPAEPSGGCRSDLQVLRMYPSLLVLYAAGITAIVKDNVDQLVAILSTPQVIHNSRKDLACFRLRNDVKSDFFKCIPELKNHNLALVRRMRHILRDGVRCLLPDDDSYITHFKRFEGALSLVGVMSHHWPIPGTFMFDDVVMQKDSVICKLVTQWNIDGSFWNRIFQYFPCSVADRANAISKIKEAADQVSFWPS
ncbi:MAG: SIR2 family protein [Phycisphaeraceae bacterium]|nr:SIR2 family protein [Phycisphaeraceae bacterium]